MDPDDPLGLGDKESFDRDVDLDVDLDHIITAMGQTLSESSTVNSLADYLVGGGHLDDKENVAEEDFLRMPVHYTTPFLQKRYYIIVTKIFVN